MIRIEIATYKGRPPARPTAFDFDESGGTLGRATSNQLVLADPEKHISRVHATVACRDGSPVLIAQGRASPVTLNGRPLDNEVPAMLVDDDEIGIGDYVLRVLARRAAPAKTPVQGGFFGTAAAPAAPAVPAAAFAAVPAAPAVFSPPPAGAPVDDPLGLFGGSPPPPGDPFADLFDLGPASPVASASPPVTAPLPATPPAGKLIPDDFDAFAEQYAAKPLSGASSDGPLGLATGAQDRLPDDLDVHLGPDSPLAGGQSVDELFGLTPGVVQASAPFPAGHPLAEQASQPNTAAAADPLRSLGLPAQGGSSAPGALSDHVSALHGAFTPPRASVEATPGAGAAAGDMFLSWESEAHAEVPAKAPQAPLPPAAAAGRKPPDGLPDVAPVSSGDTLLAMFDTPRVPVAGAVDPLGLGLPVPLESLPAKPPVKPLAQPFPATVAPRAPELRPAASSLTPTAAVNPAGDDALAQAFLRGLAVPGLRLPDGMNEQTIELLGALLRESVQGTLDLLLARAMTKREVKAELTMIVGGGNNPLKFSPDVAMALSHLLAPPGHGFMAPEEAMRDAYDDLRSHTFGFMAGMRAALAGVLARFDPANLETRLKDKSMLDSLLPMNRRAKLWDLFAERYKDISLEAEEDFHTLFGKEFLRAYEEQVARLEADAAK